MKKFLFLAALVACSLTFVSCEKEYDPGTDYDPYEEQTNPDLEKLKAAVMGSWYGEIIPIYGEIGHFATVTFAGNKFTVYQETQTLKFDILYWKTNDIVVWVVLDDGETTRDMFVALKEEDGKELLHLSSNDTYLIDNVPWDLVRVE